MAASVAARQGFGNSSGVSALFTYIYIAVCPLLFTYICIYIYTYIYIYLHTHIKNATYRHTNMLQPISHASEVADLKQMFKTFIYVTSAVRFLGVCELSIQHCKSTNNGFTQLTSKMQNTMFSTVFYLFLLISTYFYLYLLKSYLNILKFSIHFQLKDKLQ